MQGLELARRYYEAYGRPMLEREFPQLLPYLAVGLCGSGSECFGYDDEISRDHDFEPGFCIFLPGEETVDRRSDFLLERAYAKLPDEFLGFRRQSLLPVGGARHGVLRTGEFFRDRCGVPDGRLDTELWLTVPEQSLAEAVNGEIYLDGYGEVTAIRERLREYPGDLRLKKLAGSLLLMAQAGSYNYPRCLAHGETGAAQLALYEYVGSAISAAFLLNRRYQPFYKWRFRALRELPVLADLAEPLEKLISMGNGEGEAREKTGIIRSIGERMIPALSELGLETDGQAALEDLAYAVNDRIGDPGLRTMHILAAV